jgi:hypothetical protein
MILTVNSVESNRLELVRRVSNVHGERELYISAKVEGSENWRDLTPGTVIEADLDNAANDSDVSLVIRSYKVVEAS